MVKKQKKQAVIVLGMHRSGTSAVMRMCNLLGVDIGNKLLKPNSANEAGFWEHEDIVDIHEEIFEYLGSSWDNVSILPDDWHKLDGIKSYKTRLKEIINRNFSDSPLWGMKDPRQCRLLPLWLDIFNEINIEPLFIIVLRNPDSVALSLNKRDGFVVDKSLLLWCEHNIEAEISSRGYKRCFLSFENIMSNWQKLVKKISSELGLNFPIPIKDIEGKIGGFLNSSLVHNNNITPLRGNNSLIRGWVDKLWKILGSLEDSEDKGSIKKIDKISLELCKEISDSEKWRSFIYSDLRKSRKDFSVLATARNDDIEELQRHVKLLSEARQELKERDGSLRGALQELDVYRRRQAHLEVEIERLEDYVQVLHRSTSWRVTKPLRASAMLAKNYNVFLNRKNYQKAYDIAKDRGVGELLGILKKKLSPSGINSIAFEYECKEKYTNWIRDYDTINDVDRDEIRNHIKSFKNSPLISIVMPVYEVEEGLIREAIESVLSQLYENWELCIADDCSKSPHIKKVLNEYKKKDKRIKVTFRRKNGHISECSNSALKLATGEFIALLDNDDIIPEHALYMVVNEINEYPDVDMIYSDEDKLDPETGARFDPYFKSDWNPDLFYSQNMFSHLGVYRKSIIDKIKGFRKGYEGSQDYDLALRCLPHTSDKKVRHIPHVLYHWRAIEGSTAATLDNKSYCVDAGRRALQDYLNNLSITAKVEEAKVDSCHHVVWPIPEEQPKIALIIPTKNAIDLVRQCVESIVEKTTYKNYEIVIVNNNSDEQESLDYFDSLEKDGIVTLLHYNEPFNFSAINNYAVENTESELLAFVNNDIEIMEANWLDEMVAHALRPEIGAVGAKLYYPDGTVQHGGVLLGMGAYVNAVASHLFHRFTRDNPGYFCRAQLVQNLSAVTAACMVMRREVFNEVGGYNEKNLAVAFNDVDLCLKVRDKGYRIIWTPHAELYHHESATRGAEDTPEKKKRFEGERKYMRDMWSDIIDNDPYYNPNLELAEGRFLLSFPPRVKRVWKKHET